MAPEQQIVEWVRKLVDSAGSETELNECLSMLEASVPHPAVSDLIFQRGTELSAQEIVELALAYRPIQM